MNLPEIQSIKQKHSQILSQKAILSHELLIRLLWERAVKSLEDLLFNGELWGPGSASLKGLCLRHHLRALWGLIQSLQSYAGLHFHTTFSWQHPGFEFCPEAISSFLPTFAIWKCWKRKTVLFSKQQALITIYLRVILWLFSLFPHFTKQSKQQFEYFALKSS